MQTYSSMTQFLDDLLARLTGPMHFRLILQPLMAIALGIRDGRKDARAGRPPFVTDLLLRPEKRGRNLKEALKALAKPLVFAIVLDGVVQYLMFGAVYPGTAVLVGVVIMGLPYSLARGVTNRIVTARRKTAAAADI